MKHFVSLALVLVMLAVGLTGMSEEKKGFFGSIGDGLSNAWNWTKGAADDVAGWTSNAAKNVAYDSLEVNDINILHVRETLIRVGKILIQ